MARIKGSNTRPEIALRKILHSLGLRYRLNGAGLLGKPDLIFPGTMLRFSSTDASGTGISTGVLPRDLKATQHFGWKSSRKMSLGMTE
ncbi:very short patch repair endonuclease [Pseudomonas syringae]|uniref:very short patch repair endonuclease n=1 Tax=Pseudomonas syringae TaxID=317 RepID=UPI001F1E3669|nr:very short patch repair endonuclease [Pseudomonas syringae]